MPFPSSSRMCSTSTPRRSRSSASTPTTASAICYTKIETLPEAKQAEIKADIQAVYAKRPALAMVNSDKGITNLHVPSDIIIDASMPAMIRDSGKMWGADGKLHDTKAMIPDRCYARCIQAVIEDCKKNGAFDPDDHGLGPQRRPDGAEGRGVRLARQDLRDPRQRHGARRRRRRQGAAGAASRSRRHLAHVPDQGRADPGLGQARRAPRARHQHAGGVLARQEPRARRPDHRQGREVPEGSRHQRVSTSASWRRSRR